MAALAADIEAALGNPPYTVGFDVDGRLQIDSGGAFADFQIDWTGQPEIAATLGFTGQYSGAAVYTGSYTFSHNIIATINEGGNGIKLHDNNPPVDQIYPLQVYDTTTARDLGLYTEDDRMTITSSNNIIYFRDGGGVQYKATLQPGTYNGNQMVSVLNEAFEWAVDDVGNRSSVVFDISYDANLGKVVFNEASEPVNFDWVDGGPDNRGSSSASVLGFTRNHSADVGVGFNGDHTVGTEGYQGDIVGSDLNPVVNGYTTVSSLYESDDVTLGKIKITNGKKEAVVDLSDAGNVQDIIERINSSGIDVVARVNYWGTGLEIYSLAEGTLPVVTDDDGTDTATLLGLQAGNDIIGTLNDFKQALIDNDADSLLRIVANLDAALEQTEKVLGDTGSRLINIQDMEIYVENFTVDVREMLQNTEEVDMTEAVTKYLNQQQAFEVALQISSKTIQLSLLDFLG